MRATGTSGTAGLVVGALGIGAVAGAVGVWSAAGPRWPSYAGVFERAAPGVVNVRVGEPPRRIGTGFAIADDAVVTARHLVLDAVAPIVVRCHDGRSLEAVVVGSDARTDLALLAVDGGLPPLPLGASDLPVGETVVAIGNPYGLGHSLSAGVLAQRGRRPDPSEAVAPRVDFLQLSMALHPGNSGGPVLDADGGVVGVLAGTHAQGAAIAFAVPVEALERSLPRMRAGAHVSRAWLGVTVDAAGVVSAIVPSSPADRSGIQVGDRLLAMGGRPVGGPAALQQVLDESEGGAETTVALEREGAERDVRVLLADWADQPVVIAGMTLAPEAGTGGAVVAIRPRSRAEAADVRVGDVVLAVDEVPVRAPADVKAALDDSRRVQLALRREGRAIAVQLEARITPP